MLNKTKLIVFLTLAFSVAFILGNTSVGAQNRAIDGFTSKDIQCSIAGGDLECLYCPPGEACTPMVDVTLFVMPTAPTVNADGTVVLPSDAREVETASLTIGEGGSGTVLWGTGTVYCNYAAVLQGCPCSGCP